MNSTYYNYVKSYRNHTKLIIPMKLQKVNFNFLNSQIIRNREIKSFIYKEGFFVNNLIFNISIF